jgi:hypothetical protein
MDTIIYRKSDRLVAGISHRRRTPTQETAAVAAEIRNVCASELGGVAGDYGTVKVAQAIVPDMDIVVNQDGSVTWVDNPAVVAQRQNKESARIKLKALGLTDEEITALRG